MEILVIFLLIISGFLVYDFISKPDHAVFAILAVSLINMWVIYEPSVDIGLHIYLNDPLFIAILLSALYRVFFRQQIHYISYVWLIFGLILFYNLFAGIQAKGASAGVPFRNYFYYWTGALYFMSFDYSQELLEKALKNWYRLCLVLLAIVYFRFVAEFLNLPIAQTWIKSDDNMGLRFRVTHSTFAYLLSITTVMVFARYLVPGTATPKKMVSILLIFAVLALQHRSVWMATMTGIAIAGILPGIKTTRLFGNIALVGILGLFLALPLVLYGVADVFLGSINEAADRATHLNTGTFGSRVKAWDYFLSYWDRLSFARQLTGEPFADSTLGLRHSLHNFYLQTLKDTGVIGFICAMSFYLFTLAKLYFNLYKAEQAKLYYAMFFMLLIGQLTFYIPYSNQAQHGVILGLAASLARRKLSGDTLSSEQRRVNEQYFLNTPERMLAKGSLAVAIPQPKPSEF